MNKTIKPFVSVIVVNYNTSVLTTNCINSILNNLSRFDNFEVIVIDNKSTDDSKIIFENEFNNNSKVRLVFNKSNYGYGKAINIGVKNSKGSIILIANSDIVIKKFKIKILTIQCTK